MFTRDFKHVWSMFEVWKKHPRPNFSQKSTSQRNQRVNDIGRMVYYEGTKVQNSEIYEDIFE